MVGMMEIIGILIGMRRVWGRCGGDIRDSIQHDMLEVCHAMYVCVYIMRIDE